MKEKFHKRYSPKTDLSGYEYIIVGSGISGLTAAVWLAKAGKKVAVLERHYVPGGFTHSFKRKGKYEWDVGVHYVGNVGKDGPLKKFFSFLSDDEIKWNSIGEIYDVAIIGGNRYEFKKGEKAFQQQMEHYFPSEKKAIAKYLSHLKKCNQISSLFLLEKSFEPFLSKTIGVFIRMLHKSYSKQTTLEYLESITQNKELIAVLCAQCGNYGLPPNQSSFVAHALVIGHFLEGGYYPEGGSSQIATKTLKLLDKLGVPVYVNAEVSKIVVENKQVQGFQIGDRQFSCKNVISTIGVKNTFNHLLSENDSKTCKVNLDNVKASTGHLCLYVGLDKSSEELNLPKHNIWWHKTNDLADNLDSITLENIANQFAYISFPSAKDPDWDKKHPNKSTIQALSKANYEWFKKYKDLPCMKRSAAYEQLKKEFETTMLEKLYELFPQIKGHIAIVEVSTPLSTRHFSNYEQGEIYGLSHSPERFNLPFLRYQTKIKGLRLGGQDIALVGVAGAMISGLLSVVTILKFKTWHLFKEMDEKYLD